MAWRLFLVSGSLLLAWSLWPTWSAPPDSESGEFHARRHWDNLSENVMIAYLIVGPRAGTQPALGPETQNALTRTS